MLFINLNPGTPLGASETLHLLQGSFNSVYPSLLKYNGNHYVMESIMMSVLWLCFYHACCRDSK